MHGRYHLTFESGKTRASEKAASKEINQVRLKHRACSLSAGLAVSHQWIIGYFLSLIRSTINI
jgi:hypothetical protein